MTKYRAFIRNEDTGMDPWFVYVESEHMNGVRMAARFGTKREAEKIATALNRSFEREGKLWTSPKFA